MPRKRPRRPNKAPEICPVCGADVHPNALACRECGADHNSGWREDAHTYDALDLPGDDGDDDFNYDEFIEKEFGSKPGSLKPAGLPLHWWITGILLFLALLWLYLGSALF